MRVFGKRRESLEKGKRERGIPDSTPLPFLPWITPGHLSTF
jgi:hypothetical protein